MKKYNPSGKIAGLGLQTFSAYLMFAQSANGCVKTNNNVIERECVLAEGKKSRRGRLVACTQRQIRAQALP